MLCELQFTSGGASGTECPLISGIDMSRRVSWVWPFRLISKRERKQYEELGYCPCCRNGGSDRIDRWRGRPHGGLPERPRLQQQRWNQRRQDRTGTCLQRHECLQRPRWLQDRRPRLQGQEQLQGQRWLQDRQQLQGRLIDSATFVVVQLAAGSIISGPSEFC